MIIAQISDSHIDPESNKLEDRLRDLRLVVEDINKQKPSSAKGKYITNSVISLSMSPGIFLDIDELLDIR